MEINFVLNVEDIVALQRHLLARRFKRSSKRRWFELGIVLPFCALVWILYAVDLFKDGESKHAFFAGCAAIIVFLLFLFPPLLIWWASRNARRSLSGPDREKIRSPRQLILTPESMQSATHYANATYYWTGIDHIGVTANHIFIYISSTVAHVVPRRAFADDREFEEFAETAKQYMLTAHEEARRSPSASERMGSSAWQEEASKHFQSTADRERLRADDTEYRP